MQAAPKRERLNATIVAAMRQIELHPKQVQFHKKKARFFLASPHLQGGNMATPYVGWAKKPISQKQVSAAQKNVAPRRSKVFAR